MDARTSYATSPYHSLEREGRLIVFNPDRVDPLLVEEGGAIVLDALRELESRGGFARDEVEALRPGLFDMLAAHRLVAEAAPGAGRETCRACPGGECRGGGRSRSKSVYLILTNECNQACAYCLDGAGSYRKDSPRPMRLETARTALAEAYADIEDGGFMEVVLFGGEPLLNWELAKRAIDYAEGELNPSGRIGLRFHLTTNLTLFPPDLIERSKAHGISFLVDVDGPREVHDSLRPFRGGAGSFETTARNVARLADAGIPVALRATVTALNQDLRSIVEAHKALGGASSALVPVSAADSDRASFPASLLPDPDIVAEGLRSLARSSPYEPRALFPFSEYLGRFFPGTRTSHGCGAPYGNTPVVCADGGVYSCIYLVGDEKYRIGSVGGARSPAYDDNLRGMREAVDIESRPRCAACPYRSLCGGGCPVCELSIALNPAIGSEARDYTARMTCLFAKTAIEEMLWYAAAETRERAAAGGSRTAGLEV